MEEKVLKAQLRQVIGKQVKALRREGLLPAIIYGKGSEPILISLDYRESSRLLPTITSSQLVVVDLDGKQHTTLVREKQRQPVTGNLIHVDFQEVSLTEKLRASVMIELVGEAPAVENLDGILVTRLEELYVEAFPGDLPERIRVDISGLKEIGDAIHVSDIHLVEAIEVLVDADEIVVVVTAHAAGEMEEGEGSAAEPEVIERGKKEDDF
jgi:large subunit ribosomal protein L25